MYTYICAEALLLLFLGGGGGGGGGAPLYISAPPSGGCATTPLSAIKLFLSNNENFFVYNLEYVATKRGQMLSV